MPGPDESEALAKVFKLGPQEVVDIIRLEFQEDFFNGVWAVISSQGLGPSFSVCNWTLGRAESRVANFVVQKVSPRGARSSRRDH
jgi:hypothetical protein